MKYSKLDLGTIEAVVNKLGGMEGVQKFLRGELMVSEVANPLLEFLGVVTVPATTERFSVRDRIAAIRQSGRKIYMGSNLEEWFLNCTVEPVGETEIRYHKLLMDEVDGPIIAELGGKARAKTTLGEVFALMGQQLNGENGVLLTNGYANIFYIRDVAGVLRVVGVDWRGVGWDLDAGSVDYPYRWDEGSRVLSRNS